MRLIGGSPRPPPFKRAGLGVFVFQIVPSRREAGLEIGYPEKICHHDGRRTTTTYKNTPPSFVGAQCSFWSFFIDFELMSNFFVAQEKGSRQIVCFSG